MADFQIKVIPGLTAADTTAEVVGAIPAPKTAFDPYMWGYAVGIAAKGTPYPGGHLVGVDLSEVKAEVIAAKVTVHPPDITPKALAHKLWDNSDNDQSGHYEATLSSSVERSNSVGWSRSTSQEWSASVSVEVGGGPVKATASAGYSLTVETGKNEEHTVTTSIDSSDTLSEDLKPHTAAIAVLLIQSGSVVVSIDFEVKFSGGPVYYAGRSGKVALEDVIPHLNPFVIMRNTMTQTIDFFRDTESKIVSIPDGSSASVNQGIGKALAESERVAGGSAGLPRCLDDAEIERAITELGQIGAAIGDVKEILGASK